MKISRSQVATNVPTHKLPACWEYTNVGNVAALQPGYAFKSTWFTDEGVRLLRGTNIVPGGTRWEDVVRIPLSRVSEFSEYDLNVGDIVIAMDRPVISTGLKVTVLNLDDIPSLLLQRVGRFRLMGAIESEFLFAFLNGQDFLEHTGVLATGTQLPHISKSDIESAQIPIPPLNEQGRIVTAIESLQQRSAKARTLLTEVELLIDKLRQSILHSAFSGRLTADWRAKNPDVEPADQLLARIRVERRQRWEDAELAKFEAKGKTPTKGWREKYKEPITSSEEVLQKLPDSWRWATIDELAIVGTGSTPKRNNNEFWVNGTIPWITSTAVNQEFVTEESELVTVAGAEKTRLKMYPKGTLLIALYGEGKTRGMVTELSLDATINQALAAMQFNGLATAVKPFAKRSMIAAYERMRQSSMGGVQPNLNLDKVRKIQVPVAPLTEQIQLLKRVDEQLEHLSKLEIKINAMRASLSDLNSSILAKAFRGELVPQDPKDEPASELLARIQAARKAEASTKKASKKKKASL